MAKQANTVTPLPKRTVKLRLTLPRWCTTRKVWFWTLAYSDFAWKCDGCRKAIRKGAYFYTNRPETRGYHLRCFRRSPFEQVAILTCYSKGLSQFNERRKPYASPETRP